jgi:hypothetical protein
MPHSTAIQCSFEGTIVTLEPCTADHILRRGVVELDDGATVLIFVQGDVNFYKNTRVLVDRYQAVAHDALLVFDSVSAQ